METNEIAAAVSTPYGRGGISVIRISGKGAVSAACGFFAPKSGKKLTDYPSSRAVFGSIFDEKGTVDEGIATVFYGPHSFTGEDTVEISCHGGIVLTETVLSIVFKNGIRAAGPGEFTKRAFLNGKISLTEAEAVMDLIDAENEEKIRLASAQSSGVLSRKIDGIAERLSDLLSEAYVTSDYPDEDLADISEESFLSRLSEVYGEIEELKRTYRTGSAVCEGVPTVIAGKPNTGKSSLLNALLGTERAIVTDIPGTTRDTIDATVNLGKIMLHITDTAGLRESDDVIEEIGVEKTKKSLESVGENGLVLAMFNACEEMKEDDLSFIDYLVKNARCHVLPVLNKTDVGAINTHVFPQVFLEPIMISAKTGDGIERLKERIVSYYADEMIDYSRTPVISNARQYAALRNASDLIGKSMSALGADVPMDMVCIDVELAYSQLCEIDGRNAAENITDKIFSRFCVGK